MMFLRSTGLWAGLAGGLAQRLSRGFEYRDKAPTRSSWHKNSTMANIQRELEQKDTVTQRSKRLRDGQRHRPARAWAMQQNTGANKHCWSHHSSCKQEVTPSSFLSNGVDL